MSTVSTCEQETMKSCKAPCIHPNGMPRRKSSFAKSNHHSQEVVHDITFSSQLTERIDVSETRSFEDAHSLCSVSPTESFHNNISRIRTVIVQDGYDCDFLDNNFQYRYTLFDEEANPIGYAMEDHVQYCDNTDDRKRAFDLHIINMIGDTVVNIKRTIKCIERKTYCGYGPFFHLYIQKVKDHIRVKLPGGADCGYVVQHQSFAGRLTYKVYSSSRKLEYLILGPRFTCNRNMKNKVFSLKSPSTDKFNGKIARRMSEFSNVTRSLSDSYFGLSFPLDTPLDGKILLLAAGFLINCMFYADKVHTKLYNYDQKGRGEEKALSHIESRTTIKTPTKKSKTSLKQKRSR